MQWQPVFMQAVGFQIVLLCLKLSSRPRVGGISLQYVVFRVNLLVERYLRVSSVKAEMSQVIRLERQNGSNDGNVHF